MIQSTSAFLGEKTEDPLHFASAAREGIADALAACETTPPPDFPQVPGLMGEVAAAVAAAARVPFPLAASEALGIASAAIGKGFVIEDRGRTTPANLFMLVCARSASGKSESLRWLSGPLREVDHDAREHFAAAILPGLKADLALLKHGEKKLLTSGDRNGLMQLEAKRDELTRQLETGGPRLIFEDVTSQALSVGLASNGEQLAIVSGDAGDVLDNLSGRYADGTPDDSLWLKAYSREAYASDRIGRRSVILRSPWLAALLVATPDRVAKAFLVDRFREGGLLPRFLVYNSEAAVQLDEGRAFAPPGSNLIAWGRRLSELVDLRNVETPRLIRTGHEASEFFRMAHNLRANAQNAREASENDAFDAREVENARRVALVLHVVQHGAAAVNLELDAATAETALRIVERCAFDRGRFMTSATGAADAAKLAAKVGNLGMTIGKLKNDGWLEPRVMGLVSAFPHLLTREDAPAGPGGGRPTVRIRSVAA
jgi:hypothetical protein